METVLLVGAELSRDEETRGLLGREGYDLLEAATAVQAREVIAACAPKVVIVEQDLEGTSGLELLKETRRRWTACEVVLVTKDGEADLAIDALRAGALDYLHHPIDLAQLRIALGRARERRSRRREIEAPLILVVDDHLPTLKRLALILRKEGFRVEAVDNGEEALRRFRSQKIDLILADIRMPGIGGLTLLKETKGKGEDVEVIVVSGHISEEAVVQALRDGAVNFLRKPIDIDQMLLAIQRALEFQAMRRSLAYRTRDVELMQALVLRLDRRLELVMERAGSMGDRAREFLRELVDALPVGILVIGGDRRVVFANRQISGRLGAVPPVLAVEWLRQIGLPTLTQEALDHAFDRAISSSLGTVEVHMVSRWAFLVTVPLRLVGPEGSTDYVAIATRGERAVRGAPET